MADNQETPEVEAGSSSSQPEKEPEDDKGEKNKGKKPVEDKVKYIYPVELEITWGKDKRYWSQPADKSSKEAAELKLVCWLQVTGSTNVETGKSYEIKFNISFKDDAFGWKGLPLFLMAKIGEKGKCIWKKIKPLEKTTASKEFDIPNTEEKFIVKIPGDKDVKEQKLFFGLYEIWSNKWKAGLLINYATVEELPT